jgi:hypothetical protein
MGGVMKDLKPRFEWVRYNSEGQYNLIVSCHQVEPPHYHTGPYRWCVYLQYIEGGDLDKSIYNIEELPLHWGVSYDRRIHTMPYKKEYDWQQDSKSIKIGADYNHCDDRHYTHQNPLNGIPIQILRDIDELEAYVQNQLKGGSDEYSR